MSKIKFQFFFTKMIVKITKNIFSLDGRDYSYICAEDVCTCSTRLVKVFEIL